MSNLDDDWKDVRPTPEFENRVYHGNCLEVMRTFPDASIDAVITDPPYGLGNKEPTVAEIIDYLQGGADLDTGGDFMGKDWSIPSVAVWKECLRVLKPGGYLLSFGGTRTWDLISLGLRAAEFENRDTIAEDHPALQWKQGQGFPKSLNVSRAIDKAVGAEPEVVGRADPHNPRTAMARSTTYSGFEQDGAGEGVVLTAPATAEAKEHEGKGTALKPSWEPILVFRKPLDGTVADNVLKYGTGALNIDATRVQHSTPEDFEKHKAQVEEVKRKGGVRGNSWKNSSDLSGASDVKEAGRWPPNAVMTHAEGCQKVGTKKVKAHPPWNDNRPPSSFTGPTTSPVHHSEDDGTEEIEAWKCIEGCPVRALDEQTGDRPGMPKTTMRKGDNSSAWYGRNYGPDPESQGYGDSGGASRFFPQFEAPAAPFFYTGKATKKEATLDGEVENVHPTRKPVKLMRWLVKLVTPKGGLVLDPYCGSGSTLQAAVEEELRFCGIDKDEESYRTASKRVGIVLAKEETHQHETFWHDFEMNAEADESDKP